VNTPSVGARLRQYLMTGVSYMIPFVAAGGILIALGFAMGGYHAYDATEMHFDAVKGFNAGDILNWAFVIFWLGKMAFAFFVPVLAAFIAYGIADRPGIAPVSSVVHLQLVLEPSAETHWVPAQASWAQSSLVFWPVMFHSGSASGRCHHGSAQSCQLSSSLFLPPSLLDL